MADQKNTAHDNAIGWGILGGVLFCIAAFIWYFYKFQIKSFFRWIRWGEMWLASWFLGPDYVVRWNGQELNFDEALRMIPMIPASKLSADAMDMIGTMAMTPLKLPMALIMAGMGLWCMTSGPGTQFRRKLNLGGLIGVQSKTFPYIAPFIKFNPSDQPPRAPGAPVPSELPLFAEALGPEEWLAYNQIPVPDGQIDEQACFVAFAQQLGPRWQGPFKMAPYKQILMAVFCLKASRKRKDADEMLGRLAHCWSFDSGLQLGKDKTILKDAQKILRDRKLAEKVLNQCNRHGFETTAMLRGLMTARSEGGVLAPAQFVWLRAHDRTLWYPLNNLGRQAYHMEALGAMAHFKAERMTQRPIPRPKVQDATKSIIEYMSSMRARPIPQLDYSGAKKGGVKKPQGPKPGVKAPAKKKSK